MENHALYGGVSGILRSGLFLPNIRRTFSSKFVDIVIATDQVFFHLKNTNIFHISQQKHMLWYSLEAPRQMFLLRNKKSIMRIPPLICSYALSPKTRMSAKTFLRIQSDLGDIQKSPTSCRAKNRKQLLPRHLVA